MEVREGAKVASKPSKTATERKNEYKKHINLGIK